jgi:hypothetical protein
MWRIRSCQVGGLEDSMAQVELVRLVDACLQLLRPHRESGARPEANALVGVLEAIILWEIQ